MWLFVIDVVVVVDIYDIDIIIFVTAASIAVILNTIVIFSLFYFFLEPLLQRSDVIQHESFMASGMHQLTSPSRSRHRSRSKSPKRHGKPVQPPTKALRTLRISSRSADEDDVFRLNPGALQNRE